MRGETEDLRAQLEQAIKQRGTGKPSKEVEAQIADLQQRLDVRPLSLRPRFVCELRPQEHKVQKMCS